MLLTPGERVDLAVGRFQAGETIAIDSLPYERGAGWPDNEQQAHFGTVPVGAPAPSTASIPARLREIAPLVSGEVEPNRTVLLRPCTSWRPRPVGCSCRARSRERPAAREPPAPGPTANCQQPAVGQERVAGKT